MRRLAIGIQAQGVQRDSLRFHYSQNFG